ncbi:MAG TPA: RNA-binding S4 domain-containing protein [Steroidobacteraceae bacterium]|nr:RNA-binding S4 domain-containing protein [Steroidobacteraceae bacterium]
MAGPSSRNIAAEARHRVDRWLWFARFFRSRSLATAAVSGGKVHVNGERVKPSRELAAGDILDITLGADVVTVRVLALPSRRGPATEAQACYEETADSRTRRDALRLHRKHARSLHVAPPARPDKRGRRAIRQLHGRN